MNKKNQILKISQTRVRSRGSKNELGKLKMREKIKMKFSQIQIDPPKNKNETLRIEKRAKG